MDMDIYLRLGAFLGLYLIMALWEWFKPRRTLRHGRGRRWLTNLGLLVLNSVLVRLTLGAAAVEMAIFAQQNGWGLFNYVDWPITLEIVLGIVVLDFAIYLQHVMSHHLPILWRLHRVHHADLDLDVSSGGRFHPLEILISLLYKVSVIAALGPSVGSVIIFELLLNLCATFNHGNVYLPPALDKVLRLVLVTPDVHRIHHSQVMAETNSNFGFSVTWWDHLCGTYCAEPQGGQLDFELGLSQYPDPKVDHGFGGTLIQIPVFNAYPPLSSTKETSL